MEKKFNEGLFRFLDDCFLKLLNLKINEISEENIKEIVIPKIGSIVLGDSTTVKVNNTIYKEPLYGPFLLLNCLSLEYVDDCEIRTVAVEEDTYEKVYDNNILKVAKIFFLTNKIGERINDEEIFTVEGSVKKNEKTQEISFNHADTSDIIRSYEIIYENLGGIIDYNDLEFSKIPRRIKGFINAFFPVESSTSN